MNGTIVQKLVSKIKGHENVSGENVAINLGDIYSDEVW